MQRVIKRVHSCLCDLKLAIDGTIVMSPALKESLDAMYDARIPETWMKVRPIPPPLPYMCNQFGRAELSDGFKRLQSHTLFFIIISLGCLPSCRVVSLFRVFHVRAAWTMPERGPK